MHRNQEVTGGMAPSSVTARLDSFRRHMLSPLRQASDPTSDRFIFTYVYAVKARGLYDYPGGSADELPFSEGDVISVVDRSDSDWYKAEKDGVIFIVPAAYLEIEG